MSKAHNVVSTRVVSTRVGGTCVVGGQAIGSRLVNGPVVDGPAGLGPVGVGPGEVRRGESRFDRRAALALAFGLVAFASSETAFAANRVVWKKTKLKEQDKSWKIAFEVHLDRAPDVALVPFRLSFTGTTYFERALVDGQKGPVVRQVPLRDQQPIIESVD